ncbi:hypothetical protein Tco_0256781 [Tanacetum coccineum]
MRLLMHLPCYHRPCLPPSAHTVPETITPTDRARDSPVTTPLHDDPYMLVRQAYTPIVMDPDSEPFEDPIETEETHPLSPRAAPLSPDYTPTFLDYTPDTPHSDKDSEPMEASETRTASPSGSTSPLSPAHPLTQTSPIPTPSRAFYYRGTARMVVHTQPTLLLDTSSRVTEAMTLSPSSFRKRYRPSYEAPSSSALPASSLTLPLRKRYRGTSKPILDTETEGDESEANGTGSESEESKDKGPGSESEEIAPEGQQQQAVLVEDTTADEPLGLGYEVARRRALELVECPVPNTFKIGQSSRSVPDQQRVDETPTPRLPTRPTWVDPKDDTVYIDINYDAPPVRTPVQTPASPEWSSGSLPVSPASLTVPSPVASPVTTPAATIAVDEDEFLEVGAQLELHGSILYDHTQRLDALPPTLFEGYSRDFTWLFARSEAVRDEIHLQRFRLRSLERGHE